MLDVFLTTYVHYAGHVLPWFAIGVVFAWVLERKYTSDGIARTLGEFKAGRVLAAMVAGMVSPLSIMPQIPVAGSMVRLGAHPALLLAFLAAERAYDFYSFPIIAGFFGAKFAVLNAIAIYAALVAGVFAIRGRKVEFKRDDVEVRHSSFWRRQAKLLAVVIVGIGVGAFARAAVPETIFGGFASTDFGGLVTGILAGFGLYFGTILGNYPVAGAFADLGMSTMGVFAFLTVSPLISAVVIAIFASAARLRDVLRFFAAYGAVALALSVVIPRVFL